MLTIPISAVPSQTLSVTLDSQPATIAVYQKSTGLYLDLAVNDAPVLTGVLCLDRVKLIRSAYRGFAGDLAFVDTQGTTDPSYTGLGTRFVLIYVEPADEVAA